ncbi:MAG TPA: hypothetical protein VLH81_09410, partial [Desulfobacterales bacterium]|nr:hypothetical protein [Desulfobacterales bacterium]
ALRFRWQIFGDEAGTAADKLDDFLEVLRKFDKAGSFADALAAALAEGGAGGANAFLDELAKRFASGDQSLFGEGGIFAGLTADEVRRLLEEGNTLLEDMLRGGGTGTTQDFVQARSITEITASRIEGALYTENALSSERNALLRQLVGMQMSPSMVTGFTPGSVSPASYAPSISTDGGTSIAIHMNGPVIGQATFQGSDGSTISEAQQEAQTRRTGRVLGEEMADAIDRRLGTKMRMKLRSQGRAT